MTGPAAICSTSSRISPSRFASAVAGSLRPTERARLAKRATTSSQALEHLMRGNVFAFQRSTDRLGSAILQYRLAVQFDSTSPEPRAKLAFAYAVCVVWEYRCNGLPQRELIRLAAEQANVALRLDSTSAPAWLALGEIQLATGGDPVAIASAYRRATELDSSSADAWHLYGVALMRANRDSASIAAYRRALAIDPTRAITYELLARVRLAQRLPALAIALLDTAVMLEPQLPLAYLYRAPILAYLGDTAATRRDIDRYLQLEIGVSWQRLGRPLMAMALAYAGDAVRANALADSILADSSGWNVSGQSLAGAVVGAMAKLGRLDAFWRHEVRADGSLRDRPNAFSIRFPGFDPIRNDPRIVQAVAEDRRRWERIR